MAEAAVLVEALPATAALQDMGLAPCIPAHTGAHLAMAAGGPGFPPPKKTSLLWLWILIGVVVFGFGSCMVCVAVLPEPDPEAAAKRVNERRDTIKATEERLVALYDAFPEAPKEAKCDDSKIPTRTSAEPHHVVDYHVLKTFAKKGEIDEGRIEAWPWLTASALRDFTPLDALEDDLDTLAIGNMVHSLGYLEAGQIIVVIQATDAAFPKVEDDENYTMGHLEGWAVVFDYVEGKPLCQAKLRIESSEEVFFTERGLMAESFEEAIADDFAEQVRDGVQSSLGRISDKVEVSMY